MISSQRKAQGEANQKRIYPDDFIYDCLRWAAKQVSSSPMSGWQYEQWAREMRNAGYDVPGKQTVMHRFGCWRDGMSAAGLPAHRTSKRHVRERFSNDDLLDAVGRVCQKHNYPVSYAVYVEEAQASNGELPSGSLIRHRLGMGWIEILNELGYE